MKVSEMYKLLQKTDYWINAVSQFFTPRRILLLSFGFAIFWMLLFLTFNVEIYRDMANCYAWYAREFGHGYWNGLSIAALPPLNIFLGGIFVKCGVEAYQGLMFLGGLFFALTIFPLYGLLKNLLPAKAAAWGCFLFVMTPKIIRFSCMGLLEATRDFFLVSAVYLLFLTWRNRAAFYHYILFGAALGFLALSRGEGIVMAGLLFLSLFVRSLNEYRMWNKKVLIPVLVTAFSATLILSPRLIETWKITGYPVTDTRCIGLIKSLPLTDRLFQDKRPAEKPQIDPVWAPKEPQKANSPLLYHFSRFIHLLEQMSRGGYEFYLIFTAIGIGALIWLRSWKKEYSFLLIFSFAVSIIMGFYSMAYRYFVFLVPLFMVFTLYGMIFILNGLQKYQFQSIFVLILGGIALGQTQNAWGKLFKQKQGRKEVQMAQFLKENKKYFLPADEQNRKLIICDDCLPEIVYRADEARILEYARNINSPTLLKGFDVFILARKEKEHCKLMQARKDLKEIPHPLSNEYLLLAIKREDKKK